MAAIDLSQQLKKHKKGWVAFNEDYKIIETADTFEEINKKLDKVKGNRKVLLFPASDNYYGFIT